MHYRSIALYLFIALNILFEWYVVIALFVLNYSVLVFVMLNRNLFISKNTYIHGYNSIAACNLPAKDWKHHLMVVGHHELNFTGDVLAVAVQLIIH